VSLVVLHLVAAEAIGRRLTFEAIARGKPPPARFGITISSSFLLTQILLIVLKRRKKKRNCRQEMFAFEALVDSAESESERNKHVGLIKMEISQAKSFSRLNQVRSSNRNRNSTVYWQFYQTEIQTAKVSGFPQNRF
jgi:hypothetical protein